ncbi:MAG: alpha-glucosidase [Epulopiscium sp. Nele67-Bin002]|nr:MAG: alpha-glucosidase [Epulopiscium sp. Nele67-Bin002]OON92492.1 MAG: alpha-glucosidase [Epulopiscium sp. Nele67-Bin001]
MELQINNNEFKLKHNGHVILSHSASQPLLYVGVGDEDVEMYRGNFKIEDYLIERIKLDVLSIQETDGATAINFGDKVIATIKIVSDKCDISFEHKDSDLNRFFIRLNSSENEKCFGLGEQMSYLNVKGRNFPIFTSEPGVGRDKSTYMTWKCDVDSKSGGDYYNSNFPQPTFISSNMYFLHLNSTAYADFNFKNNNFTEVEVWEIPESIVIEGGKDYFELLEKLTALLGRQPELPDWVYNGLIVGLQGGNERTFGLLDKTLDKGIKVAAVWAQDWCGKRFTSFGKRLQWDWHFHNEMYPNLPEKIAQLHERGIKFMGYVNPYLVDDGDLYKEGKQKGFFATKHDGTDYLVDFGEFNCGVVDLTNPQAYEWFKNDVIKKHSIDIGMDGWMADFGEYLPTDDIKLYSGKSAMIEHNHWPVLWAKCNYDAVNESGKLGEIVYFMRAGGAGSQKYCTLLWAGDQSVDFTLHDGLASTICGALSAGMTGVGLSHSDIGGYTSLYENVRDKELFLRWAEMSAFTPVMRTHEGNRPDTNFQYYDDDDCMTQLARLVDVYTMLKEYIKELVAHNSQKGIPVQRPLFLHYPTDEKTYEIQYQYLFGSDILVAPVHEEAKTQWEVYLPDDEWIHLWTGKEFGQGTYVIDAPMGYPPVFYRKTSAYATTFAEVTNKYGSK